MVPGVLGSFGRILFLVLNVRLGIKEEGIQGGRSLDANSFGKIVAIMHTALEEILFHVVGRRDLDCFLLNLSMYA